MVTSRKINFTQLGYNGTHCEQCFRQNFTKEFGWLSYNLLLSERIFGKQDRKAIAIDPSYISKSGKRTPWIGYFWSGCAGQVKRGLEIMGIGLIDIDKRDCMMLKAVQSPDTLTLVNRGVILNDWYLKVIEQMKEQLLSVSKYVVADVFFSKHSFIRGLQDLGFHLVIRLRDDSSLLYLYQEKKTGKEGHPKTFDGKIDVSNLDDSHMEKLDIYEGEGKLYILIVHSKALKRNIRLVIWITPKGAHKLYFFTDTEMSGKDVIQYYRIFRDCKQFTGLYHSQAMDINRLDFAFNASMTAVNVAKIMMKENNIPFSIDTLKNLMYNSYILKRFFELSGFMPNRKINAKLVKELIDIAIYKAV